VKKSLWKAVQYVAINAAAWPAAWFQSKAQAIHTDRRAKDIVALAAAEAAAKQFNDPALAARALGRFGQDIVREQANVEDVLRNTADELWSDPPSKDASDEVDDDWLVSFLSEASKKSNAEMKSYMSKILAGEIKEPGTFSIKSVVTLGLLTKRTATAFQNLCNLSCVVHLQDTIVISSPFGPASQNSMQEFGINYGVLNDLAHYDLITTDFNSWRDLTVYAKSHMPIDLGGKLIALLESSANSATKIDKTSCITISQTGSSIRKLLSLKWNREYVEKLKAWFHENGVDIYIVTSIDPSLQWKPL